MESVWQVEIRPVEDGPVVALGWVRAQSKEDALNLVKRCDAKVFQRDHICWPGAEDEYMCWMLKQARLGGVE
jgi:hypothetical protein